MITPQQALARLVEQREIFHDEMLSLMRQIMSGELTPVQIAGIIIGLRVKKETVGEIAAAAQVMREFADQGAAQASANLVDTCGTGGDAAHTFNISTAAAFVAAAAGARVAKHGGRSVSSTSGSADVLEALGVNLNLTPEQVAASIDAIGIGFMFAPKFHGAMKHAAPVRRELGVRTIFNILGPLTNPAGAPHQLMGVFHPDLVGILVRVLQRWAAATCMVVHGSDGMDEITPRRRDPGRRAEGRRGHRIPHPSARVRPRDLRQRRCSRYGTRRRRRTCCSPCWTACRGRRATSCCSTPVPRSMWPIAPPRCGEGIAAARAVIEVARRATKLAQLVEFSNRGAGS